MNLTNVFLNSRRSLTEKLLERVSSYDIFCSLIGETVEVGKVYLSPIRADKNPTFILFVPDDKDEVFFKDFAWVGGNIFKFVKLFALYQESINLSSRLDVVQYIDRYMGIGLFSSTPRKKIVRRVLDKSFYASKRIIKFKAREFTLRDLQYWKKYHITLEILKLFNVRSVHKILNENNEVVWTVSQRTLTFVYIIFNKVKLYRPEENSEYKWRNTCPGHYIQGYPQLSIIRSKNKHLIITKSLKDVMVFHRFVGDKYDCIAPHSETYIFSDKFLAGLYRRYETITIIYDFDLAGVSGVNRLRKRNPSKFRYKFVSTQRMIINGSIKIIDKDISDYVEDRSEKDILSFLKNTMGL